MTTEAQKLEKKFWLDQAEEQFKRDVFERDSGVCVCGAPIEVIHHLLGRSKPRGWKGLSEEVKAVWTIREDIFCSHVELNGRGLCLNHHMPFAHRFGPTAKRLLLRDILHDHADRMFGGKRYWAWYGKPPFLEFLA